MMGGMEQNPYQSPTQQSAPPAGRRKIVVVKPPGPIVHDGICRSCGRADINIKALWVWHRVWCFFVFVWFKRRLYLACPKCMRAILWQRCRANILTANVFWLLFILPFTIIYDLRTRWWQRRKK
jgi:hypothetical protein